MIQNLTKAQLSSIAESSNQFVMYIVSLNLPLEQERKGAEYSGRSTEFCAKNIHALIVPTQLIPLCEHDTSPLWFFLLCHGGAIYFLTFMCMSQELVNIQHIAA